MTPEEIRALGPQNFCEMPEVAMARYIERLRAEEGDSLTILGDDPEANTTDKRLAVECNGGWTNWQTWRFYGESVQQCIAKAICKREGQEVEFVRMADPADAQREIARLRKVLNWIDEEAPTKEPHDGPTVGFQPSHDPEQDDGNEIVVEAFNEGVARGLWIAANKARTILENTNG